MANRCGAFSTNLRLCELKLSTTFSAIALTVLMGGYEFIHHGLSGISAALPWIGAAVIYRTGVGMLFTIYRAN